MYFIPSGPALETGTDQALNWADTRSVKMAEKSGWWDGISQYVMTFVEGIQFAINPHTIFMLAITMLCTFCCAKGVLNFSFDTSMSIVAVGTIFPLVFSVQVRYFPFSLNYCPTVS